MKIVDILESQNIQEGPLDTVGTAIGKTVGGVAKAAGAVAGGVAGIGTAVKKGYQAGKATVGGTDSPAAKKIQKVGTVAKSNLDAFNRGLQGQDPASKDKQTMQDPFEIIKSLNKAQKQKLYNYNILVNKMNMDCTIKT